MCGRYAAAAAQDTLVEEFRVDAVVAPPPAPSYNIAPTDPVPAIWMRPTTGGDGHETCQRQLTALRWGLVPSWSKTSSAGARLINARRETLPEKPSFRRALAVRRCLLPALGYYEWQPVAEQGSGRVIKQPSFLRPADGGLLVMAGLYEFWRDPHPEDVDEPWVRTCTIITTTAADNIGMIHDRMPVTLDRSQWEGWLSPDVDSAQAVAILSSAPQGTLAAHRVGQRVNKVGNDGPDLIEPLGE